MEEIPYPKDFRNTEGFPGLKMSKLRTNVINMYKQKWKLYIDQGIYFLRLIAK